MVRDPYDGLPPDTAALMRAMEEYEAAEAQRRAGADLYRRVAHEIAEAGREETLRQMRAAFPAPDAAA